MEKPGVSELDPLVSIKTELFDTIKMEVPDTVDCKKNEIVEDVPANPGKEREGSEVEGFSGKVYFNPFYCHV